MGVRAALGASRARILRQLIVETLWPRSVAALESPLAIEGITLVTNRSGRGSSRAPGEIQLSRHSGSCSRWLQH